MGITNDSLDRLRRHGLIKPCDILELGAQNLYDNAHYGQVAKGYFLSLGINHTSWDITPHQGAIEMDLRNEIIVEKQFDIIADFGTTEHVSDDGFYMAHKNIHNHCKVGGYIIHENPKTGHWPGHGCNYVTKHFYEQLATLAGYEIIELTEHFAMGNITDGCNVCVVMKKLLDEPFIDKESFDSLQWFKQ
jgi:hypothetical protein